MDSILHIHNPAGVATTLAHGQRKLGYDANVLVFSDNSFRFQYDELHNPKPPTVFETNRLLSGGWRALSNFREVVSKLSEYDVLHFHMSSVLDYRRRLFPRGIDVPLYQLTGTDVVVHHHGSNIRGIGVPKLQEKFADALLVSTPDLLDWSPNAEWIPNPIETDSLPFVGPTGSSPPHSVVHAPSDRHKKGTDYVISAIDQLQDEGYEAELTLVEDTPHEEAIEIYKSADIIVDQLELGWYGMFSIEAMALGKPVCVYIDDKYSSYLHDSPLINVSKETLVDRLRTTLEHPSKWEKIGEQGRDYVKQTHGVNSVAKRVVDIYQSV